MTDTTLCTESLGVESFNGRMALVNVEAAATTSRPQPKSRLRSHEERKEFPPPLTSAQGSSVMRSVKKDGRFLLSVVKRPQIFQTSRRDGRLIMQLARPNEVEEEIEQRELPQDLRRCQECVNGTGTDTPFWSSHRFLLPA